MRGALVADRTCSADGCERQVWAREWCTAHYQRWQQTGAPGASEIRRHGGSNAKCEFPGCGRKHEAQGFCPGHLAQKKAGKPLAPLQPRLKTTARDALGRKLCRVCVEWLPVEAFYSNPNPKDGLHNRCIRCARGEKFLRDYGITTEEYEGLLEQQDQVCKICARPEANGRQLSIDHDHACCPGRKSCGRCIRGLLCNRCNMGIGYLGEDLARLQKAIEYLGPR